MGKIKFAVLGAGHIANKFCRAVELVEGAEVVAVASQTEGKAKAFAENYRIAESYTSYEAMLKEATFDVVYIATTHNYHFENVMLCLQHKKHILCEKPFVLTEKEARTAFEAAKEAGVFVMEAMWTRFLPAILQAKAWIEAGKIGNIQMAHALIGFKANEDPKGRIFNPELAGGAMYDIGVYTFEIMTYLIPETIQEIHTMTTKAQTGVDKVDNVAIRFETCLANLQTMVSGPCAPELRIHGSEGYIVIPNPIFARECTLHTGCGQAVQEDTFTSDIENGFEYQIQEVVKCIQEGKLESSIVPHETTLQCAKLFDQCFGTN